MKTEEIILTQKSTNGYVRWGTLTWILGGIIAFAGFAYAIRVDSSDKQFANEDAKIKALTDSLNNHMTAQNQSEKETAAAIGRIEQVIKKIQ
jgi:hypothetical protein